MKIFHFFILFITCQLAAQEEIANSVYFEFDKNNVEAKQEATLIEFIKKIDSTRIESLSIFGYCDDRGKDAYNFKLSTQRANNVQNLLIKNGIKSKIIVSIEGKGKVVVEDDLIDNLPEVRSKNRRVDVVVNLKPLPKIILPGIYNSVQAKHQIGDRIMIGDILFEKGSSKLNVKALNELNKIAQALLRNKKLKFEIQGHICCTPSYHKEAIDRSNRKRQLSINRAKQVYEYFVTKKIDKARMTFKGYGNTQPLGKDPQYDRRVEIVITGV